MAAQELFTTPLNTDANKVSYWRMEGNSNDTWGSNNGTDTSITYSSGNGKFGQGAGFNGSSSLISIANATNLRITGALTLHAWINPNDATPSKNMVIFAKGDQNSAAGLDYTFTCNQRKIRAIVSTGSATNDLTGNAVLTNNAWSMIDVVYIPSTSFTIYVNGSQDIQTTTGIISAIQSTTHSAAIGRDGDVSQDFFTGNIDDLAIFNRALTATEISNLYNGFPAGGALFFSQL